MIEARPHIRNSNRLDLYQGLTHVGLYDKADGVLYQNPANLHEPEVIEVAVAVALVGKVPLNALPEACLAVHTTLEAFAASRASQGGK